MKQEKKQLTINGIRNAILERKFGHECPDEDRGCPYFKDGECTIPGSPWDECSEFAAVYDFWIDQPIVTNEHSADKLDVRTIYVPTHKYNRLVDIAQLYANDEEYEENYLEYYTRDNKRIRACIVENFIVELLDYYGNWVVHGVYHGYYEIRIDLDRCGAK